MTNDRSSGSKSRRGVTAFDVAEAAGVSPATAARVLGRYGSTSPEVRERVIAAARSLGYRPNRLARSMVTGLSNAIGVAIANIEDQFFSRIVRGITDLARQSGYDVILTNSDENVSKETHAIQTLIERQVDGLVVAPASTEQFEHLDEARRSGIPIVLLDRNIASLGVDAVVIDGLRAAEAVTTHLIDLGHRSIAIITEIPEQIHVPSAFEPPTEGVTAGSRLAGYLVALRKAGIEVDDSLIASATSTETARKQAHAMLNQTSPSAIFATDNGTTLGVLECLQERDVEIPGTMSLFGFDDLEWTKVACPPISVVAQPIYELGATAAGLLLQRIRGDDRPPRTIVLPTTLVHRESVARARPERPGAS